MQDRLRPGRRGRPGDRPDERPAGRGRRWPPATTSRSPTSSAWPSAAAASSATSGWASRCHSPLPQAGRGGLPGGAGEAGGAPAGPRISGPGGVAVVNDHTIFPLSVSAGADRYPTDDEVRRPLRAADRPGLTWWTAPGSRRRWATQGCSTSSSWASSRRCCRCPGSLAGDRGATGAAQLPGAEPRALEAGRAAALWQPSR